MKKNKDFYDKPIYSVTNYIFWFLLGSVYLFLCNILLILFLTVTSANPDTFNLLSLFIALLPVGPSIGALASTMREILKERHVSFSSYFFNSYKNNFKSTMKLWTIILMLLFLMFIDFQLCYLNLTKTGLYIIFVILGAYIAILSLYAIPISCKFELKIKDIFILSAYYSIRKLPITILKIVLILGCCFLALRIPSLLAIFLPSIVCYIVSYYDNMILDDIEERHVAE